VLVFTAGGKLQTVSGRSSNIDEPGADLFCHIIPVVIQ